jgi:ribosomal protein S6--L-glutamate ligase
MILSYHPILKGDRNLLCAGRDPNEADFIEMRRARAILLPQGCRRSLFDAAARFCPQVFPDHTCCFRYPGKLGDIELFRAHACPHPESWLFPSVACCPPSFWDDLSYPIVLKGNHGGEGSMVFELKRPADRVDILEMLAQMERNGYGGFLVQEKIETMGRDLRVVVMGDRFYSYWRVQRDGASFYHNVSRGAEIDKSSDPDLQVEGIRYVRNFCLRTGINLAGLDLLFRRRNGEVDPVPLFLEINYYFGRKGLGGSEEYYKLLRGAVDEWLGKQLDFTAEPR